MPADIFISYSSQDRERAQMLTELLASAGLSVWIDQLGIDIAASWSKEIVKAISGRKVFIVLLSPFFLISNNVIKEVSLPSEKGKEDPSARIGAGATRGRFRISIGGNTTRNDDEY